VSNPQSVSVSHSTVSPPTAQGIPPSST
jgi:hypothetical protein